MIIIFSVPIIILVFSLSEKEGSFNRSSGKRHKPIPGRNYGTTWWGKRFLASLEALCGEKTASLGRAWMLDDMVYDVSVSMGHVSAKVEGPHGEEYRVKISFERIQGEERRELLSLVSRQDVALPLLSNELPAECDSLRPLFRGFRENCTCPDEERPCMHVAAVFYVLSAEIDNAPQMLFFLRGIGNDEILSHIRGGVH